MSRKICATCGIDKPISDFYRKPGMKDTVHKRCKACHLQYCKERIQRLRNDPEFVAKLRSQNRASYHRMKAKRDAAG